MSYDGLNASSPSESLPGLLFLIRGCSFPRIFRDFYCGAIDIACTTISSITNGNRWSAAHEFRGLCERCRQCMSVIDVCWEMNRSHNDAAVCGHCNRCLEAKLMLCVIFAFTNTIHLRFMATVNLIGAVSLLRYNLLEKCNFLGVSPLSPLSNPKRFPQIKSHLP